MITTLPKTWHLKVTNENFKTLGDWMDYGPVGHMNYNKCKPTGYIVDKKGFWTGLVPIDSIEISFEEFKVLVLGEHINTEPNYEIY